MRNYHLALKDERQPTTRCISTVHRTTDNDHPVGFSEDEEIALHLFFPKQNFPYFAPAVMKLSALTLD